jgi:phage nucleotide-binding protein
MMKLSDIVIGKQQRPLRLMIYGQRGVGKTTFAAGAPHPIFIATEDGTAHLNVARFPIPKQWEELVQCLSVLAKEKHEYQTVVIDSLDWVEQLAQQQIAKESNVKRVADMPFGQGYKQTAELMFLFLKYLNVLYNQGLHIILIAHSDIKSFNNPAGHSYDMYQTKINAQAVAPFKEWCDVVGFAYFETHTTQIREGAQHRIIGESYGKRILITEQQAFCEAKNRYNLPNPLSLSWQKIVDGYQITLQGV